MRNHAPRTLVPRAAHKEGMNILSLLRRIFRPGNDRGEGLLATMVGLALATVVIGVPIAIVVVGTQSSTSSAQLQEKDTSLTTVLNRTSQSIQVAEAVLYATPNEMVVKSKSSTLAPDAAGEYAVDRSADAGATTITRWILQDGVFYQQVWENPPAEYVHTWRKLDGSGEPGTGQTAGLVLARDVKTVPEGIFAYFNREGGVIAPDLGVVPPAQLAEITRVKINIGAGVQESGKVENETYATLRNAQAPASDYAPAATCPTVTITTDSSGKPRISWEGVSGASGYQIFRDGALAASPASSAREWVDASVSTSGRVVNYKVISIVAGVASDCSTSPFRSSVKAPAPVISVLPAGTDPSSWVTSGLTKPRINLTWEAVANASGYELFMREVDAATGNSTAGFTKVSISDPMATTYTWDDAGWGKRYEWYLHVSSRAGGSADSARVQTLTNPAAPASVKTSAAYSTGAQASTHGTNTVTWDAVEGSSGYDLWRYNSGKSGAVTKIASVTATKATDTVEYGTEFTYYVTARNSGPRGTNAAGAAVSGDRPSAPPESAAAKKAAPATQLQYPPTPTVKPLGTGADNTRDLDGQNRILWDEARSASGYYVARSNIRTGAQECLTGSCKTGTDGTAARSFLDPADKGTQKRYHVMAYNKTGMSKDWSLEVNLTQRPAAPQFDTTSHPTLSTDGAAFRLVQNADAGNGSDNKFCAVGSSDCSYELTRIGRAGYWSTETVSRTNQQNAATITWTNVWNYPGNTTTYQARSKNTAITNSGFSDYSQQAVNTYPGAFWASAYIGDAGGGQRQRMRLHLVNNDLQGSDYSYEQNGFAGANFGGSTGSYAIRVTRHAVANDNAACRDGLPCSSDPYQVSWSGGASSLAEIAAPGATYYFEVRAMGDNGWTRTVNTGHITTPTDVPQHGKVIVTCAADNVIGSKLVDFNPRPRYGHWSYTFISGLRSGYMGDRYTFDHYGHYYNGGAWNTRLSSSNGTGYYYGVSEGFDIQANGNGGYSARIRQAVAALAPHTTGCAGWGARGDSMQEPSYPCYGYSGGSCQSVNNSNRPQWTTR